MSGGTKKQYKQYPINSIQEACQVLGSLIVGVIDNLKKYKEYSKEVKQLLDCTDEKVTAKVYEDINDKLLYRQFELLKYIADHQGSSFSYIDIRALYEKRGYLKSSLTDEAKKILNEFLDLRNWTFHNPQSMMVARKEVTEKSVSPELRPYVKIVPQLNPIVIPKAVTYDLPYINSLLLLTQARIKRYDYILDCMKKDYQELFDSLESNLFIIDQYGLKQEVQYIEYEFDMRLSDNSNNVAQVSMAIQKSKYDGTDDDYNKWALFHG